MSLVIRRINDFFFIQTLDVGDGSLGYQLTYSFINSYFPFTILNVDSYIYDKHVLVKDMLQKTDIC